jgi:ribonuclease PH
MLGVGFTKIVNCKAVPEQELEIGVTIILAVIGTKKLFNTVKGAMLPLPVAAIPIAGLVLVH